MSLFILVYFRVVFLQTDTVQALRGDPDSSEAEHARIMLVQTEAERVKFVVRSYIRTRLYKVRCLPFIASLSLAQDERFTDRKACTVHCFHARGAGEVVSGGTGSRKTVRAPGLLLTDAMS
jgi:hypothetical protein